MECSRGPEKPFLLASAHCLGHYLRIGEQLLNPPSRIFAASTAVVGAFGVASKIGSIISIILVSISIALVRLFSSASEHKDRISILGRLYDNSVYFGLLAEAPIAAYLIDFPQAFINSVFPAYQAAVLYAYLRWASAYC